MKFISSSVSATLFSLLIVPLLAQAQTQSRNPSAISFSNTTVLAKTSLLHDPDGSTTEIQTFIPTTSSKFVNLTTAISTSTAFTVTDGTSTTLSTNSYEVSSGGVGSMIPTHSSGATLLAQPSYLSGSSSSTRSSTTGGVSASSTYTSVGTFTGSPTGTSARPLTGTTSGTSDVITSTITSAPSGFIGKTLAETSYTANGWITTTDGDQHTTLLPLIVIGGGRGIVFWDLPPIPDVEFSLPNFPKFHLPCIKVFGVSVGDCTSPPAIDGPPPDDSPTNTQMTGKPYSTQSSSESKSSSSCTVTKIASNCMVNCINTATSSSCASYSTTCSETMTGCSVQGTTSTISSTGGCLPSANMPFWRATQTVCDGMCASGKVAGNAVPSFSTSGPNPSPDYKRRAIAGRITADPIEKRGSSSIISTLGGCALQTPAAQPLTRPGWPSVFNDMIQPERAGNMEPKFSLISRYDRATKSDCVFTTTRLSVNDWVNAPAWQNFKSEDFNGDNNRPSLDHAYEKKWLNLFFNQVISPSRSSSALKRLSCDQTNQYFFPKSSMTSCQYNIIQSVWNELASEDSLDFIAMSQYLNGNAKGMFFPDDGKSFIQSFVSDSTWLIQNNADWTWPSGAGTSSVWSAQDAMYTMLGYFEEVLYGVLEMRSDNMLELIDKTNNRIYGELQEIDSLIDKNVGNLFGNTAAYKASFPYGIAEVYKTFMINTIEPQINIPPKYLTDLWTNRIVPGMTNAISLPGVADPNDPNQPGIYGKDFTDIWNLISKNNEQYYVNGAFLWDYDFTFGWDTSNRRKRGFTELVRRQGQCPIISSQDSVVSTTTSSSEGLSSAISATGAYSTTISGKSQSSTFSLKSGSTTTPASSAINTACTFVTTVFPSSVQSIAGSGTREYCQCGPTMAAIAMATSAASTTTFCNLGSPIPSGYTQIPVSNGIAITSTTSPPTATTSSATSTTTSSAPPVISCTLWTECPTDFCKAGEDISCTDNFCVCWK